MNAFDTVDQLEDALSEPTPPVVELFRRLTGDLLLLGAGGKIGPSLAHMAVRAARLAGTPRRVIGVSRFAQAADEARLQAWGVETIRGDLLDEDTMGRLPDAPLVLYLAGWKFGSQGHAARLWAMNSYLPGAVCRRFRQSRIVAYSTGNVYGLAPVAGGGSLETDELKPVGEYAMSCVGRERVIEHFSRTLGILVALIRLNYACDLRYGVLVDLARRIVRNEPVDLATGHFNTLWQGDANAAALLALEHAASPPFVVNLTGPELLRVRDVAAALAQRLGRDVRFVGLEADTAIVSNARLAQERFGLPRVSAAQLVDWEAGWIRRGGELHDKPTRYEARDGRF